MRFFIPLLTAFLLGINTYAQSIPQYGPEIPVTINGLTFDAMEPFIAPDGQTLFFNSLNAGGNTNLYYATRVNDSTFNFAGVVNGTLDTSSNHLDAVASLDSTGNFYWVSLRGYPNPFENLHHGTYAAGTVSGIRRTYGDFNIPNIGWLIMDAAITYNGQSLLYCNAYFDLFNNTCGALPCEASIGIADKVNDSTFNKRVNTNALFSAINDTNYLVYAPQLSPDGLTLYYTRLLKNTINTEICVAVRPTLSANFGTPVVIHANLNDVPEAPTITSDHQLLYYHQKDAQQQYRIYMRRVQHPNAVPEHAVPTVQIFPNPSIGTLYWTSDTPEPPLAVVITDVSGNTVFSCEAGTIPKYRDTNEPMHQLTNFASGAYFVHFIYPHGTTTLKWMVIK